MSTEQLEGPVELPTPCRACDDGRMGAWAPLRVGGELARLGEMVLIGRHCDRCRGVEIAARKPGRGTAVPGSERSRSPGADLLHGLARNLAGALGELWAMRPKRRREG
jgi:hypothetical protein